MKKLSQMLADTFQKSRGLKFFLLSILISGLSYGLYKGIIDNYLADVVHMGEMDKGITEFFRELPGVILIFILAAVYMLSAESVYKMGAVIMLAGMSMHALFPPDKVLITLAICTFSLGEHIQLGMKSSLTMKYAQPGKGGAALGVQSAATQISTLIGYIAVMLVFYFATKNQPYTLFFALAAILAAGSMLSSFGMTGKSSADKNNRRFYFHKKYHKYYMLEMFYGARKQVFITFGPFVLIRYYSAGPETISLLFAISAIACFIASPFVGKIIDRIGYKKVMVADTLVLVAVCLCYGFAHHVFLIEIAMVVCCVNYVLDSVISLASMASNVYVKALSDTDDEVKATVSTGVSINHVISVFIALFGGWVWQALGIELLFICSAVLGVFNSLYAMTIKTGAHVKN